MTRWYTNVRDLWVEPKTGVVVKGQEQLHQYYGRNKDAVDVEVLKVTLPFDEATIEYQVQQARDGMDKLSLFGRTVPIVAGVLGVIALIAGIFLGIRGGKGGTPARAAHGGTNQNPSGQGSPEPAPGEHDWTSDDTQVIPRPDLRKD